MKKRINLYMILGFSFLALFVLLFALLFVDRANIAGTGEVGLSSINKVFEYKYNKGWQIIADIFLYLGLASVLVIVGAGIGQLFKRKSLFKVDRFIIIFGIFLLIAIFIWIMFEYVIAVNYRPIYVDGNLEASFPSTHTFLTAFIFLSLHGIACILFEDVRIKRGTLVFAILVVALVALSRILSGMHYLTDVLGGLFIGLSLYFTCFGIIKSFNEVEEDE